MPTTEHAAQPDDFAAAHEAWHAEVERGRVAPHGPLSATALHWLTDAPQEFPGVPGRWSADRDGVVTVVLPPDSAVRTSSGAPLQAASEGVARLGPLSGIESLQLDWGEKRIELAARSGRIALRPRDPASPDRTGYAGTATFPPRPDWLVTARFVPAPRDAVEVASAAGPEAKQHYDSPGTAEFEIGGTTLRLTLFGDPDAQSLRAIFADRTGEDLTFPAARFVSVTRVSEHTVEIDFNRTTNLPCAYSASATCPFPPPENRLPVRIEAGELRPGIAPPSAPAAG
ncbi:DUF1684 domain-containing protein [Leucobacter weissii]|uniref:DUF1684 domain-containing protein n=1 Tax=Leucobacter weissii TaxID=1983706 RepID=A0A939S9Y0_9MICO|nr:DUF1684 domain-containing protein [Leucobacter weissii]MBO1901377.1 DUF1684 domain-containing protein [Leucobacter weissii]